MPTQIKLKQLKANSKPVAVFSEADIKALLVSRPKRQTYLRTWTPIVLMLDTGWPDPLREAVEAFGVAVGES